MKHRFISIQFNSIQFIINSIYNHFIINQSINQRLISKFLIQWEECTISHTAVIANNNLVVSRALEQAQEF